MKYKTIVSEVFQILLGIFLASVGLKAFLLPNGFLDGGVTGLALLANTLLGIDISLLLIILSIPFLVVAYFHLPKRILFKSILSIALLAISVHLETFQPVTDDKLLIAIFGGLCMGAGIGLTIKNGAVMDGSEILGILVNGQFGLGIGQVILMFNVLLFSIAASVISIEVALYSTLTYVVAAKVADFVIEGFEDFIGVMIISKENPRISKAIVEELGSGITVYQGKRGVGSRETLTEMEIVHTIINRIDLRKVHKIIDELDEKAFVVEYDVNRIQGGVQRRYMKLG